MNALILLLALAADPAVSTTPRAVISGDTVIAAGKMAKFSAGESENAASYTWIVRPKPRDLEISNGLDKDGKTLKGSELRFTTKDELAYEVELIVGSIGGETSVEFVDCEFDVGSAAQPAAMQPHEQAAMPTSAGRSFTISELATTLSQLKELQGLLGPPAPQPIAMGAHISPVSPQISTLAMAGHPNPPADGQVHFPDGVRILASQVNSQTRSAEGKIAAGCFRSVANRIKVGTFSGTDPWNEVQRACREALGNAYANWQPFFIGLGQIVDGAKQQGLITNPQSSILLLESAAEALGRLP